MKCGLCGLKLEKKGSRQFNVEGPSYHQKCYMIKFRNQEEEFSRKKRGLEIFLTEVKK